jgi:hypothetical protein
VEARLTFFELVYRHSKEDRIRFVKGSSGVHEILFIEAVVSDQTHNRVGGGVLSLR